VTVVHVVVPDGVDDPVRASGGNVYDRRICRGLRSLGWAVHEHAVPGDWPHADAASRAALAGVLARLADGTVVLLDGLIASTVPELLLPSARRLRLVVLVHLPLGLGPSGAGAAARARECAVLTAAAAVVTTSAWTRHRVLGMYAVPAERVHVAEPGADAAALATGTASGGSLLCVAAVTPGKGHDVLVDALAATIDVPWTCVCVGSLDRDPAFVADLRRRVQAAGLGGRVGLPGPATGADLDRRYAAADLMVLASRAETYGMVVTEALARGVPVVAADVGGVGEAMGHGAGASRPGLLVPPDDAAALAAALRAWLCDADLRERLRRAARERRAALPRWSTTASVLAGVLAEVSR
jgi:glycosyltransferase involved in cell wall biosynthesis